VLFGSNQVKFEGNRNHEPGNGRSGSSFERENDYSKRLFARLGSEATLLDIRVLGIRRSSEKLTAKLISFSFLET